MSQTANGYFHRKKASRQNALLVINFNFPSLIQYQHAVIFIEHLDLTAKNYGIFDSDVDPTSIIINLK